MASLCMPYNAFIKSMIFIAPMLHAKSKLCLIPCISLISHIMNK